MAFVSIKSAKPGEDVVIVIVDNKLRNEQQLRLNTSGLDGMNSQQIAAAMKLREINLPDDVYFRRNTNGGVDVATGAEPGWDKVIQAGIDANREVTQGMAGEVVSG